MSDLQRELSQANSMLLRADYLNLRDYEVNDLKQHIDYLEVAVDTEKNIARMTLLLTAEVA
jgi:hypothetical protein